MIFRFLTLLLVFAVYAQQEDPNNEGASVNDSLGRPGSGQRKRVSERKCEEYSQVGAGGENAPWGETSHLAGWGVSGFSYCMGSLISPRFVITTTYCARGSSTPTQVRLGEHKDAVEPLDVKIKRIHINPNYQARRKSPGNIALLELERDVVFNAFIHPACLWNLDHGYTTLTSWGTNDTVPIKQLHKFSLSVIENDACAPFYKDLGITLKDDHMCASELRENCYKSSSPPQLASAENPSVIYVVGPISLSLLCSLERPPAFTRVASHLDWIEDTVWPEEQ